jgi:hypothetical protein
MDLNYIEKWLPEATVNYKDGRPAVGFGLIITVFFRNGHLPEDRLKRYIKDTPEITLLPHNNGMIIKAGELPPLLGEINTETLPPLLVKVSQIIKPIRLKKDRSLHFYAMEENLQFDEGLTAQPTMLR